MRNSSKSANKIVCVESEIKDSCDKMSDNTIAWINSNCLPANYAEDKILQTVIQLVKSKDKAKVNCLPPPWREKFASFSLDEKDFCIWTTD